MCVETTDRVLAVTYDDGPVRETTPAVLDALAAAGVRATFFLLADRAEAEPDLVRRIVDDGHEVGLHGDDHTRLSAVSVTEAARRIQRGRRRLETLTGQPVRLFRPPYGAQRVTQVLASRAMGLEIVIWSAWALDWQPGTVDEIAGRAAGAVHPGAILLLHDATGETGPLERRGVADPGEVAADLLGRLSSSGYRTTTVGELLREHAVLRCPWFESSKTALSISSDRGVGGWGSAPTPT